MGNIINRNNYCIDCMELLIGIIIVLIAWKLVKFALKILLILIVAFLILFGLDFLGIFNILQEFLSNFL